MFFPCLLCELKCFDDGGPHSASANFVSAQQLRDHLVEYHAKFVSRALLAPDQTDQVHCWLWTTIEVKSVENENNFSDFMLPFLIDNNNSSLFQCAVGYSLASESAIEAKSNSRKRKALRIDELIKKLRPEEANNKNDLFNSKDLSNNSNDPRNSDLLNEESREVTGIPASSKAMRKSTCQICHVDVCTTARQRHVYQIHLRIANLFQCSACEYTNNNSVWEMKKHCAAVHQGEATPISNEEHHRQEIQSLNQKCFPDWKLKKTANWWREEENTSEQIVNNSADYVHNNQLQGDNRTDGLFVNKNDKTENSFTNHQSSDAVVFDNRTCQLCLEESRYPGRHIAQKHLKKPLYECPICKGFGSYESCSVAKHISKVHPTSTGVLPTSNLEDLADEIRELQNQCFPNRPMKLVRQHAGSRPRDRHTCNMCDAQVAQSDRQRHVYHRHLAKERIFECPFCNFYSNYDVHRVKWHIKWIHKENSRADPISHEEKYRDEINQLNEDCFPGWQHRRRPFWWLNTDEAEKRTEQTKKNHEERTKISEKPVSPEVSNVKEEKEEETSSSESLVTKNSQVSPKDPTKLNEWTCMLCQKEFKPSSNFLRHVAKDHLKIPLYQCPICKGHGGQDAYEIRSHMLKVHGDVDVEPISNLEEHSAEIQEVYQQCFPGRKLKNISTEKKLPHDVKLYDEARVQCRECGQEMKAEDRQIHVYRHHLKQPRLYECPVCDFSHHACSSDVKSHIKFMHREDSHMSPKANLLKYSKEISEWNLRCFPGWINRRLPAAVLENFNRCRLCDQDVRQTSRHIAEVHLQMSLHQCPVCEYGAAESRLVRRHMKNNHKKKEVKDLQPIANVVQHRAAFSDFHDLCFPGRPKRLSNITISDEGRRAKCRKCGATISRKRRLTHLLERHLKQPIYKCSICDFYSASDESAVLNHLKESHNDEGKVINDMKKFKLEIEPLASSCFLDWQLSI